MKYNTKGIDFQIPSFFFLKTGCLIIDSNCPLLCVESLAPARVVITNLLSILFSILLM